LSTEKCKWQNEADMLLLGCQRVQIQSTLAITNIYDAQSSKRIQSEGEYNSPSKQSLQDVTVTIFSQDVSVTILHTVTHFVLIAG